MYSAKDLTYRAIEPMKLGYPRVKPVVPQDVYEARKASLVERLAKEGIDAVVIYADREHYANFKYYTGVDPRFEEALLVIHADGRAFLALGNECFALVNTSAIRATGVFCQRFSLPNQPMDEFISMEKVLRDCGIGRDMRVGLIDWKLLHTPEGEYIRDRSSMPSYIVDEIKAIVGDGDKVTNETAMLIGRNGLRLKAEAAAIAAFEYGAACASQSVVDMLAAAKPGVSEMEIANEANTFGQQLSVHTYVPSGENMRKGLISPTNRRLQKGDPFIASVGMEGGLTCRSVVMAENEADLAPLDGHYYMESLVKPYMAAVYNWYETIGIGVCTGDMFDMIEACLPAREYGRTLNPGHMIGYEEWLCSPFFKGSDFTIESGMMFQMDIIPSHPEYPTPNDEDGLAIADEDLRAELERDYPEVYARIMARRAFAEQQIGLRLKPEVLPLSNCFAEFNPFAMNRSMSIAIAR